jgi:hypothetical protein
MTKTFWTLPLVVALLVVAGGAAYAIPSLGGPTGIVTVPTAAVAPNGQLQTALTYQSQEMYTADVSLWQLQALAGVSDEAELWAAYALADQDGPTAAETANMWAFGGKVQLASEPEDDTSLAVGASLEKWSDILTEMGLGDANVWKAYVVATKDFTPMASESWEWSAQSETRMLGSVGILYASVDPDGGESESLTRPFVGFEFIGAGGTALGLEYRWKDNTLDEKAVFSAVLTHAVSPEFEVQVGTTNAGPGGFGLDDQDIFVRVGYTVPMNAD